MQFKSNIIDNVDTIEFNIIYRNYLCTTKYTLAQALRRYI